MCEGRGELQTAIGDDSVVKAKSGEDVLKKDVCDVHSRGSFVTGMENYPFRKAMVDHNQDQIITVGDGEISDEIHGDLLEGAGAFRGDRSQRQVARVSIDFIGLTRGTPGDKLVDKGGHAGPPVVLLE